MPKYTLSPILQFPDTFDPGAVVKKSPILQSCPIVVCRFKWACLPIFILVVKIDPAHIILPSPISILESKSCAVSLTNEKYLVSFGSFLQILYLILITSQFV